MNTNKYVGRIGIGEILAWIALFIVFFFTITPIIFMFVASFMDARQILAMPFRWIPSRAYFTTENRTFLTNFIKAIFGNNQNPIYMRNILNSLIVAVTCDGYNEFNIYSRIVLPNCGPVIATLGILSFRNQWDNLLWPLLVAQSEKMKTIPLYITKFSEEKQTDEGAMMACALLASIPMFILFGALSKYFIGGAEVYESRKG